MRGRYPSGPEYVECLQGPSELKQRLRVVLETIAGRCRVQEACARLDVGPARFHQLRHDFLQDALNGQLPRPLGRPPRAEADVRIVELEREVAALRVELHAARVGEEIALALPQLVEPKKKRRGRRPGGR